MILKNFFLFLFSFSIFSVNAQLVDVQADYNAIGDCIFSANNNSKAPVYLHLNFADLQNTSFTESLPYVKRLTPGFNALFTLQRDLDADVPRFNYEVKSFRSNPMAIIDLKYPYLIPFSESEKIRVFDVENINGFRGSSKLDSWSATGFYANAGTAVHTSRNGVVVEVVGAKRNEDSQTWYNGWNNNITVLQSDGSLICYRNVVDKLKKIKVGQTIYAGQVIGEVAQGANSVLLLIYHHSINTKGLIFIIPQFVVKEGKNQILNSASEYNVEHPISIRGLEMTKREKKKILGKK